MLTIDPTCVALASAAAHFNRPMANGSGCTAHEAKRGCPCAPKSAVHTSSSWRTEAASFDA